MLAGLGSFDAQRVAARAVQDLEAALRRPVLVEGRPVVLGVSAGVALLPRDGASAEQLLRAADRAMYAAKAGRQVPQQV